MIDARSLAPRRPLAIAACLGVYAGVIALVPTLSSRLLLSGPLLIIPLCWWAIAKPRRWIGLFLCAAILLPPLPLPLGDSGPHPAMAAAAIGLFAGVLHLREWRIPGDFWNFSLVLYFLVLVASIPLAALYSGAAVAAASFARVLLFGIALYVFFYTAYGPGSDVPADAFSWMRLVFWSGVAAAAFACLDFYYQFPAPAGFGPQFVWLDTGVYRRAQGLFYEASTLGNFCTFFLLMVAMSLLRDRKDTPVSRPALVFGGALFLTGLILSYSRASVLNLLAALVALLWLRRGAIRIGRLALVLPASILAGIAASYAIFPEFVEAYWTRASLSVQYLFSETGGVLSGRLQSWSLLAQFLVQHPWHAIFGVGYKTLPYSDFIGKPVVADNAYLSALVETGVIGLVAMLLFSAAILRIRQACFFPRRLDLLFLDRRVGADDVG
jgi:O-antigen ligase